MAKANSAPVEPTTPPVEPATEPAAPAVEAPQQQAQTHFAEGYAVPTIEVVPATPATGAMPTQADINREWGTYKAAGPIYIGMARAFNAGDPIPASHPLLQDGEHGQGWLSEGHAVPVTPES